MEKSLKSVASNYGLYLGAILAVVSILTYAVNLGLFTEVWFGLTLMAIIIVMGIIAVAKVKQAQNGFASFKEAFTGFFITIIIGIAISTLVYFLIFNVIDTDAALVLKEKTIEKTVNILEGLNTPNEVIAKSVEQIESQNQFGIANILKSLAINIVIYSIIGLIVAAAMKRTKPDSQ
ncbi:DUF4199 domain-containing protein [Aestuariivivens insulae]|uniref:DUF4199 domain-containing protein n=1 Tax=Aestuariivivens insulae TaxID=1621988 RepID=UPI001F5707C4|nr:DUF4199 domain-containing protein [Aestuariivivens insulae]